MRIIKIDSHRLFGAAARELVSHLKSGGLIVYPTETAYALGASALKAKAVGKIFSLKKRSYSKTLPIIAADFKMAGKIAVFSKLSRQLALKHWPGPLTLILPLRSGIKLPRGLVKNGKIALRVSSNAVAINLSRTAGYPIVSTSANISGRAECYSPLAVKKQFKKFPSDLIIVDAGKLPKKKPSTIVDASGDILKVIRRGSIKIREKI